MEDILASIKRIIAEDGVGAISAQAARPRPRVVPDPHPVAPQDEVLELTETISGDGQDMPLLSGDTAEVSRAALSRLASLAIKAEPGEDNTLEGLVRDLLKPLLKEWLDANLPGLVETLVNREIARLTNSRL